MLIWRRHRRLWALAGAPVALLQALFLVLSVELHNHGAGDEFTSRVIALLPSYLHHHHYAWTDDASPTAPGGDCIGCRIEHTPRIPSTGGVPAPRIVPPVRFAPSPAESHVFVTLLLPYRLRAPPSV